MFSSLSQEAGSDSIKSLRCHRLGDSLDDVLRYLVLGYSHLQISISPTNLFADFDVTSSKTSSDVQQRI